MKDKKNNFIITIFVMTFILSILFSSISNVITAKFDNVFLIFGIMVLVIVIGIIFDAVGTAGITAKEATFHSMASARVKGARQAMTFLRNGSKISSICNDVVGDVCGIVSGSLGAVLAISISSQTGFNNTVVAVILSAFISAFTVGGKAITKQFAINKADTIIFAVGKIKRFLHMK